MRFRLPTSLIALLFVACASTPLPEASDVVAPKPRNDSSGAYVSPYRADGTLARWAERALAGDGVYRGAGMAGVAPGSTRGQQLSPFGTSRTRKQASSGAVDAAGGWTNIKGTTDLSFEDADALAVYLYARHSEERGYGDVRALVFALYPDVKSAYASAIRRAATH